MESLSKERRSARLYPHPADLSNWVHQTSSSNGDRTREEVVSDNKEQFASFILGQSKRVLATERAWDVGIEDDFLSSIHVKLRAGYSPMSGEWGNLVVYVYPSEELVHDGSLWEIAKKSSQITEQLRSRGFNAQAETGKDGDRLIIIGNEDDSSIVVVNLGFVSQEESALAYEDYDPSHIDPILIRLDSLPVSVPESMKSLQHFQAVTPYVIDALYETSGKKAPNITLELSNQKEAD